MDSNSFNTLAERVNGEYLFTLFGLPLNESSAGIDFIDSKRRLCLELKSSVTEGDIDISRCNFKVGVPQIYEYPKHNFGYQLFWAFMDFRVNMPIEDIVPETIAESIVEREIWLFGWEYINTFTAFDDEIMEKCGKTNLIPAHTILGLPNPYPRKGRVRRDFSHNDFAFLLEVEKNFRDEICPVGRDITVTGKDLHIKHTKKTMIDHGNTVIYLNKNECWPLYSLFAEGPHEGDFVGFQQDFKFK